MKGIRRGNKTLVLYLRLVVIGEKYVGCLDIPMDNAPMTSLVKIEKPFCNA